MSDAFGAQIQSAPDGFRPHGLAGVRYQAQPMFTHEIERFAEQLGPGAALVATNAEGYNMAVAVANGRFRHHSRAFCAEVARGVEDPQQGDAEVTLSASSAAFQPFENRVEILVLPMA